MFELDHKDLQTLVAFLREWLKPMIDGWFPSTDPAVLPNFTTASSLMEYLQNGQYWNYLNPELIEDIIEHIYENKPPISHADKPLQTLMKKYKETVCSKVTHIMEECKEKEVTPTPPNNRATMAVKMRVCEGVKNEGVFIYRMFELKEALVNIFGVRGALFEGWRKGSIVLYFSLPEEAVYSLYSKLKSGYATLQHLDVMTVVVFDHYSVDVCSQQISLLHKVGVACYSIMLWKVCEFTGG